jgi:hypothetical protein
MRSYARIQDGVVAEILETGLDITQLFVPTLVWVDISSQPDIRDSWRYDGKGFSPPCDVSPALRIPNVLELQAQLATLSAQLVALSGNK